ncbi:MarR family transcriptional regulator [Methanosalsum natronophilum]|uniref:MarR family transcriptional regulator n=1 Tax=Methanosalsum natronophilum TaxID=768733 RepID=A0A3R8C6F4_9EURY|nr:MAG: MarR family transcriptional regulator [Methanosalsum natronophilum]
MDMVQQVFGKNAQMTVLRNLIEHREEATYLSGIAHETGLSHSSVARVIEPLVEAGIVIERPLGKQIRTFKLNMNNELTRLIVDFYLEFNEVAKDN